MLSSFAKILNAVSQKTHSVAMLVLRRYVRGQQKATGSNARTKTKTELLHQETQISNKTFNQILLKTTYTYLKNPSKPHDVFGRFRWYREKCFVFKTMKELSGNTKMWGKGNENLSLQIFDPKACQTD